MNTTRNKTTDQTNLLDSDVPHIDTPLLQLTKYKRQ